MRFFDGERWQLLPAVRRPRRDTLLLAFEIAAGAGFMAVMAWLVWQVI